MWKKHLKKEVKSLLLTAACSHSSAELLLTPLPPLVTQLLPSTGASLHGEQLADLPTVYERSAIPQSDLMTAN